MSIGSAWDLSSDAELITAVRSGEVAAFGVLYERHAGAARAVARQYSNSAADAEDAVAESFSRVFSAVQGGGGPDVAFRAYLFTVLRRVALERVEAGRRARPTDDLGTFEASLGTAESTEEPAMAGFERGVVSQAYSSLPERWQAVLWYTEVEGLSAHEVAPVLGLTANGVAALAYRAREGLRQAYLQQHLAAPSSEACTLVNSKLGSYVRGGLAKRETALVESHLDECGTCRALVLELGDVNHGMRVVIAPLILGAAVVGVLQGVGFGGAIAAAGHVMGGASVGVGVSGGASVGGAFGPGAGSGAGAGSAGGSGVLAGVGAASGVAAVAAGAAVLVGGAPAAPASAVGGAGSSAGAAGTAGAPFGSLMALLTSAPLAVIGAAAAVTVAAVAVGVAGVLGVFTPQRGDQVPPVAAIAAPESAPPDDLVEEADPALPAAEADPALPAALPDGASPDGQEAPSDASADAPDGQAGPSDGTADAPGGPTTPVVTPPPAPPVVTPPPAPPVVTPPPAPPVVTPPPAPPVVTPPPAPPAPDLADLVLDPISPVTFVTGVPELVDITVANAGGNAAQVATLFTFDPDVDWDVQAIAEVPGGGGGAAVPTAAPAAWTCARVSATTAECTLPGLAARARSTLHASVLVDDVALDGERDLGVRVSTWAPGQAATTTRSLTARLASAPARVATGPLTPLALQARAEAPTSVPLTVPVSNTGGTTQRDVHVLLDLPADLPDGVVLTPQAADGWTCSATSGTLDCALPALAPRGARPLVLDVTAPALDLSSGAPFVDVDVTTTLGVRVPAAASSATVELSVRSAPGALSAELPALTTLQRREPRVVALDVTNVGGTTVRDLEAQIQLPAGVFHVALDLPTAWTCTAPPGSRVVVTCTLPGDLAPGVPAPLLLAILVNGETDGDLTARVLGTGGATAEAATTLDVVTSDLTFAGDVTAALVQDVPGTLSFAVQHGGTVPAGDVVARVALPRAVTFDALDHAGEAEGWTCERVTDHLARCTLPTLDVGASVPLTLPVTASAATDQRIVVEVTSAQDAAVLTTTATVAVVSSG